MSVYAYILQCADGKRYYGSTVNLVERLKEHRRGRVRTTSRRLPVRLVYFEECPNAEGARRREQSFKNGRTRRSTIDKLIAEFPPDRLVPFA